MKVYSRTAEAYFNKEKAVIWASSVPSDLQYGSYIWELEIDESFLDGEYTHTWGNGLDWEDPAYRCFEEVTSNPEWNGGIWKETDAPGVEYLDVNSVFYYCFRPEAIIFIKEMDSEMAFYFNKFCSQLQQVWEQVMEMETNIEDARSASSKKEAQSSLDFYVKRISLLYQRIEGILS